MAKVRAGRISAKESNDKLQKKLNSIGLVQECDATGDAQGFAAGLISPIKPLK